MKRRMVQEREKYSPPQQDTVKVSNTMRDSLSRVFQRMYEKKSHFVVIVVILVIMCVSVNISISKSPRKNKRFHTFLSVASDEESLSLLSFCPEEDCMSHRKEDTVIESTVTSHVINKIHDSQQQGCKMLWFSAMHESEKQCNGAKWHRYDIDYSIALNSAFLNARDSLQPVLILGRYMNSNENSTEPKKFGRWAEERGVKVIYSPRLSFQDDVNKGLPHYFKTKEKEHLQGPFIRLDIPQFIKEHNLFDIPGVCKNHVFYTDPDVIFANNITQLDLQILVHKMDQAILMYGRETMKYPHINNTGVMVMNVDKFEQEFPRILDYGKQAKHFPKHDQDLLNMYQQRKRNRIKFSLLPMQYNWKPYWGLEPSPFSQVKVIHMHGPKPGKGLEIMAERNITIFDVKGDVNLDNYLPHYKGHITQGICCDLGRTAQWTMAAVKAFGAPTEDLCD